MTMNQGSPYCDNTGSASTDSSAIGQGSSAMPSAASSENQSGSKMERARAEASDAAKELQGQASQAKAAVGDAAQRTASEAKDAARRVAEQAKGQAKQLTRDAADQGTAMLNEQKSRAADSLGGIGSALHRAAQTLHEEQDDNLAQYTDSLADGVESCAHYLRDRDFRSLLHDAGDLTRRRPELVLGGAFVAGLALVRFLKSSSPSSGGAYDRTSGQYGADYATSDQFMSDDASADRHRTGDYPGTSDTRSESGRDAAMPPPVPDETRTASPPSGLTI